MALKPGTKMVDSGVEWIGQMPEGWETRRLKEVSTVNPRVRLPQKGNISFVPMERLLFGSVDTSLEMNSEEAGNYTRFEDGDVLIAKVTPCFENGKAAIARTLVNGVGVGSSEITPIRPKGIHPEYLLMVMQAPAFVGAGVATMNGTAGLQRVSTSFWKDTPVPYPPLPIQQAIANYLDHHVGLIDEERELISKKIKLLKEQRSALIFEVVTGKRTLMEAQHLAGVDDWSDIIGSGPVVAVPTTRADDPLVKIGRLVDSGVEWIGEMPEGWETTHLKDVAVLHVGKTPSTGVPDNFDGGIPWITIADLNDRGVFPATTKKTISLTGVASCGIRKAKKGSLLVSFKLSIGKVAIAKDNVYTNEAVAAVNASKRCLNKFLLWALPVSMLNEATENIYGAKIYNQDQLGRATIPLPSLDNQQAIAEFLDQETGLIDEEIELLSVKSGLLSEKRKALIFEAVTGKIEING